MEMSPNTVSSILLPWSLWLLFFLTQVTQTTNSAPLSDTSLSVNTTLLFNSGAPGYNLRNCSCSTPILECDEALANSLCRCHTVLRSALPPAGLREPGRLTVWVKELWALEELLNRSMVGHLLLSFCGIKPMDSQYLALLGLRTLRIHSAAPEAPYPDQEITISPAAGVAVELEALYFDLSSSFHVTFLDVAVLNGLSVLKAYSVVGPPAQRLSQQFPHLALPLSLPYSTTPEDPTDPSEQAAEPLQNLLITFVY
ncbi:exosomal polycystin-1-interacting protein-like [Cebidichthys violaceus]|uniref:exosomal polycystin-1-interacting protein-like n=1 Tax=Cebidichthys violaceus TaxID=271503 RepID=UPI0035C9D81A